MAAPKQGKLKGMPKLDKVGRAAKKYLKLREAAADAKDEMQAAGTALIKVMTAEKRKSIRLDGILVECQHVEAADLIKIKKAKEQ